MRAWTLVPVALISLASGVKLDAATTDEGILIRRQTTVPVRLRVDDLALVAKARFYVTADRGMSWQMAEEVAIDPSASEPPVFRFVAKEDGTYGFATATVARDGSAEATPQNGTTIPDKAALIVIDSTAPGIERFAVTRKQSSGTPTVTVTWSSTDAHLSAAPAQLEVQRDDSSWSPLRADLDASGTIDVAITGLAKLRLVVRDQAGNASASPAWTLPAETTAPPEDDLSSAIAALPEVADEADIAALDGDGDGDAATPIDGTQPAEQAAVTDGQVAKDPAHAEAMAKQAAAEAAATAEPTPAPARPAVPPGHQDIIAPHADTYTPPPTLPVRPEVDLVQPVGEDLSDGTTSIEKQLAAAAAGKPVRQFSGRDSGIVNTGQQTWRPRRALTPRAPASTAAGRTLANLRGGALLDHEAEAALTSARQARVAKEVATALALYRRLRDSNLGKISLPEEVAYYRELGRNDEAVRTGRLAPPEARSDALTCELARALLASGDARSAETALMRVDVHGAHYRESQLLSAQALLAQGRTDQGTIVLRALAAGSDTWAEEAKALLGR